MQNQTVRTGCPRPFCSARVPFRSNPHPVCTTRARCFQNQWFLWCIWGRNSTWHEFVCRDGGCLVQHADPGVPNSPFQGLSEYTGGGGGIFARGIFRTRKFRAGFISHSGLKIEPEISHLPGLSTVRPSVPGGPSLAKKKPSPGLCIVT